MYGCSGYILIVHYSFLCRFCKRVMSSYCKPIRHCLRHRGHGSAWKRWIGRDCWWPTIYMTTNISKALQDALRLVTAGKSLTWMCSCRIFLKLLVFFVTLLFFLNLMLNSSENSLSQCSEQIQKLTLFLQTAPTTLTCYLGDCTCLLTKLLACNPAASQILANEEAKNSNTVPPTF